MRTACLRRSLFLSASVLTVLLFFTWSLSSFQVVASPLDHADAIVVLAGGYDHEERNLKAARLYVQRLSNRVILTNDGLMGGWDQEIERNPYFVEKARRVLIENGVPSDAIEILPNTISIASETGTSAEAQIVVEHSMKRGYQSIALVTSAYHTRRAGMVYRHIIENEKSGIQIGIYYPEASESDERHSLTWLDPREWLLIGWEYAKLLYWLAAG